jgi:hypothetical protein
MANSDLSNAKKVKSDEFYTQFIDIEKEISSYLDYNPNVFKGKVVLLPCDDPEWSNFRAKQPTRRNEVKIEFYSWRFWNWIFPQMGLTSIYFPIYRKALP